MRTGGLVLSVAMLCGGLLDGKLGKADPRRLRSRRTRAVHGGQSGAEVDAGEGIGVALLGVQRGQVLRGDLLLVADVGLRGCRRPQRATAPSGPALRVAQTLQSSGAPLPQDRCNDARGKH